MVMPDAFWMLSDTFSCLLHAYMAVLGSLQVVGGVWMFLVIPSGVWLLAGNSW